MWAVAGEAFISLGGADGEAEVLAGFHLHRPPFRVGQRRNDRHAQRHVDISRTRCALEGVIRESTTNPVTEIRRPEPGQIGMGADADIGVLRLDHGNFGFVDTKGERIEGSGRSAAR
jgi:hypothetical protein